MGLLECECVILCQVGSWFTFLLNAYFAGYRLGALS